ncbi:GTP-binding protein [Roseomonas sp. AR75]|uniref:GTP-binding protein n=1 Tax=Roseomonas sp. AR75 TaxID=2562311 RepID=UPI001F0FDA7B|nr:GTP-binding protein [Roseomonas sp. AR75]
MVRAKGFFWLATRLPWAGSWQLAGSVGRHEAAGFWWAAQPESRWPQDPEWRRTVLANWEEPFGDRRQAIVVIGIGMDEPRLRRRFDACLLTEAEMRGGPKAWAKLPDPFPRWAAG